MQYVNFNQGELTWHGLHQQLKICVLVLKSLCTLPIVNIGCVKKGPHDAGFFFGTPAPIRTETTAPFERADFANLSTGVMVRVERLELSIP